MAHASGVARRHEPPADGQPPLRPVSGDPSRQPIARVTKGPDSLPNDAGQEWRDYDISPYTARVTSTNRPEQAILDWILRETGYEAWHTEPLAVSEHRQSPRCASITRRKCTAVVSEMVDRFVNTEAESHAFGMRVITVGSPNWRVKAHKMLHPVATQTQGVQAWLLAKEDAALLVADLRRRSDFREHSTPHLLVNNGQSTQIAATRAAQLRPRRDPEGRCLARLRAADGPVRRRLQARIQSAAVARRQSGRRRDPLRGRPGRKDDSGHDRRADRGRAAAATPRSKCRSRSARGCTSGFAGRPTRCC